MDYADLHMHSIHSDGKLTVKEIIDHAKNLNLKAISITDHDTIEGTLEALGTKDNGKLHIIPGIEFSTVYKGEEIHILGYLFDTNHMEFRGFIQSMQKNRLDRALKMVDKFHSNEIHITMDELRELSNGESIGRPHFARLLVNKGYAYSFDEAFKKYLVPGGLGYVERYKLPPDETIWRIKDAGGISILAHPGLVKSQDYIDDIIAMKIDGLEVYHSKHNSNQNTRYYSLAKKNNLLITGGSDCHGKYPHEKPFIGSVKIPYSYVEELLNSLKR